MQFSYTQGGPLPASQTISVYCVDADDMTTPRDPLTVGLNDSAAWLKLDKTLDNTPYEVHVTVSPAGLTPGTYAATIGIASTSEPITNAGDTMPVSLEIVAAPPSPTNIVSLTLPVGRTVKRVNNRRDTTVIEIHLNKSDSLKVQ